jgi:hypothetical protein
MTSKEHLLGHLKLIHGAIRKLLDDVSEQESLVSLSGNPNHIKFLAGHISSTAAMALVAAGGTTDFPEDWKKLFGRGATVSTDVAIYPTMAEIRDRVLALYADLEEFVAHADEASLERVNTLRPGWEMNATDAVLFFTTHDFYHAGQIAMIRHALGRERMFG